MENQDNTALNQNTVSHYHFQGTCPNCGYCPHCGRSGVQITYWPNWMIHPYTVWSESGRNSNETISTSDSPPVVS